MGGGYKKPPWPFRGRALYQLQLVKSKEARKYVPESLNMVECFGYTLGGLYLARYDDSPAGTFDEMVVLAGLVWNPPTSCAWASKVYVNSREARDHGFKACGLPSHLVNFSQNAPESKRKEGLCWWAEGRPQESASGGTVTVSSGSNRRVSTICELEVPGVPPPGQWRGPSIRMSLPSFSGLTAAQPSLLKYSLDLKASVRLCRPLVIRKAEPALGGNAVANKSAGAKSEAAFDFASMFVGRPLLTIAFEDLNMMVGAPEVVSAYDTAPTVGKAIPAGPAAA